MKKLNFHNTSEEQPVFYPDENVYMPEVIWLAPVKHAPTVVSHHFRPKSFLPKSFPYLIGFNQLEDQDIPF